MGQVSVCCAEMLNKWAAASPAYSIDIMTRAAQASGPPPPTPNARTLCSLTRERAEIRQRGRERGRASEQRVSDQRVDSESERTQAPHGIAPPPPKTHH